MVFCAVLKKGSDAIRCVLLAAILAVWAARAWEARRARPNTIRHASTISSARYRDAHTDSHWSAQRGIHNADPQRDASELHASTVGVLNSVTRTPMHEQQGLLINTSSGSTINKLGSYRPQKIVFPPSFLGSVVVKKNKNKNSQQNNRHKTSNACAQAASVPSSRSLPATKQTYWSWSATHVT